MKQDPRQMRVRKNICGSLQYEMSGMMGIMVHK